MQQTRRNWPTLSAEGLIPIAAVVLSILIGAIILLAFDVNPIVAFSALINGATGNAVAVTTTIAKATPLLLIALGFTVAARGGVLNIGGEGQLTVGALAATAAALALPQLPGVLLIPICMVAGALAGGVWGAIAGGLKAHFGVNEVISTVMLNQIAIQLSNYLLSGPMIDPAEIERGTRLAQSAELPVHAWLARLVPRTLLHAGAIVALVMAGVVFVLLWRTTYGYRIRAVGKNLEASRYAGISVSTYQILALAIAGALAGLAGAIEVQAVHRRMIEGLSSGFGFSGIVVALFGKLHPLGAVPASVLFGGLLVGADKMQRTVQVSSWIIQVILGVMVLLFVSSEIWVRRHNLRLQNRALALPDDSATFNVDSAPAGPLTKS